MITRAVYFNFNATRNIASFSRLQIHQQSILPSSINTFYRPPSWIFHLLPRICSSLSRSMNINFIYGCNYISTSIPIYNISGWIPHELMKVSTWYIGTWLVPELLHISHMIRGEFNPCHGRRFSENVSLKWYTECLI